MKYRTEKEARKRNNIIRPIATIIVVALFSIIIVGINGMPELGFNGIQGESAQSMTSKEWFAEIHRVNAYNIENKTSADITITGVPQSFKDLIYSASEKPYFFLIRGVLGILFIYLMFKFCLNIPGHLSEYLDSYYLDFCVGLSFFAAFVMMADHTLLMYGGEIHILKLAGLFVCSLCSIIFMLGFAMISRPSYCFILYKRH